LITGIEVNKDLKTSSFSDVKADDAANGYALPYIEAIKKAGITDGTGEGKFDPAGNVTKEQLATFLVRTLGKDTDAKASTSTDSTVSDWAKGYVALAVNLKLLNNENDGKFGGSSKATRDLLVTGAYEAKKEIVQNNPLQVTLAEFAEGNKLNLTLTDAIDEKSVDLSKITVDGVPLDPKKDSYQLSADGKTITVTLNDAYAFNFSKQPVIKVTGLKAPFGNEVKQEENKAIPVEIKVLPKAAGLPASTTPRIEISPPILIEPAVPVVISQPVDPSTPPVTQPPVVVEPPVTEPPVIEPPVTEPPVIEPPVTEPPVIEPPVTEPPVVEPPVTQPPVVVPPVIIPPVFPPIIVPPIFPFPNPTLPPYNPIPVIPAQPNPDLEP